MRNDTKSIRNNQLQKRLHVTILSLGEGRTFNDLAFVYHLHDSEVCTFSFTYSANKARHY
jgi:hypothetical protein